MCSLNRCDNNNKMADLLSVGAGKGSIICHTGCCHKHIPHHIPYLVIKSLGRRGREVGKQGGKLDAFWHVGILTTHLDGLRPPDLLIGQACGELGCTLKPGLGLLHVLGQLVLLIHTLLIASLELSYLDGWGAFSGEGNTEDVMRCVLSAHISHYLGFNIRQCFLFLLQLGHHLG